MIFADNILTSDGEVHRQRQTDSERLTAQARGLCRRARYRPEAIAESGGGLSVEWTEEDDHGLLSVYETGHEEPLCVAIFCPRRSDEALRELHQVMIAALRPTGIELSDEWIGLVLDWPCVVTLPFPWGSRDAHIMAGVLVQCWAAAWFEDILEERP